MTLGKDLCTWCADFDIQKSKNIHHSPIRGVMAEVKTELLCTTNVTPAPTNMAMYPASHPNG